MNVEEFIAHARSWIGVPYHHQGRNRFGVDCIGFPIALMREHGMLPTTFVDDHRYSRLPNGLMEPIVEKYCVRAVKPVPGSLLLIRWPKIKFASHAAICVGDNMIHANAKAGRVLEHGFRGPWVKNLHSVWLLPGVTP